MKKYEVKFECSDNLTIEDKLNAVKDFLEMLDLNIYYLSALGEVVDFLKPYKEDVIAGFDENEFEKICKEITDEVISKTESTLSNAIFDECNDNL